MEEKRQFDNTKVPGLRRHRTMQTKAMTEYDRIFVLIVQVPGSEVR